MATLSVLNYNNLGSGLNMKMNQQNLNSNGSTNKTFNKITVQNVLSENNGNSLNINNGNNPNTIVRKIKDFGMIGSVNNASGAASLNINPRKRPLTESKQNQKSNENKPTSSASKKPKLSKEERAALRLAKKAAKENSNAVKVTTKEQPLALLQPTKIPGTPGRKGLPLPQAVARRNARERNRVKQVNNGFAALRERIPEEVAEIFENQGNNRGSGKKLSKVETLRMAVEYIRSLERLLGFDFPVATNQHNSSSGEESFSLIKDEFEAYSPGMDEQFEDSLSHYDNEEFFSNNHKEQTIQSTNSSSPLPSTNTMDMLPNITTLNGLQYIRIPGTNTYQLLTPEIFVGSATSPPSSTIDEEHFNALIDTNCISPSSSSSSMGLQQNQQTTTADQQSSSTSSSSAAVEAINSTKVIRRVQETTPVLTQHQQQQQQLQQSNVENIKEGSTTLSTSSSSSSSSLLLSPVPQQQQQQQMIPILTATTSSPSTSPQLHQQQLRTLSPATTNVQQLPQSSLRQTCAANHLQQEFLLPNSTNPEIATLHMIKQEYEEPSNNIVYQQQTSPIQQQQQHHLQIYHSAMSPPLEGQAPTTSNNSSNNSPTSSSQLMPTFFPQDQSTSSFYEGVVTLKKEFDDVLLDASHGTNVMSDESMIEAIDWWDAHTPKSEGGSLMM